jgi:hypothetical protein
MQVLDAEGCGHLSSERFCAAIKKLVLACMKFFKLHGVERTVKKTISQWYISS